MFLANSFDKYAGAFKFTLMCLSQLFDVKFSNLSFSNNEALFIKQSKYFNLVFENFIIFFKSCVFAKSPATK